MLSGDRIGTGVSHRGTLGVRRVAGLLFAVATLAIPASAIASSGDDASFVDLEDSTTVEGQLIALSLATTSRVPTAGLFLHGDSVVVRTAFEERPLSAIGVGSRLDAGVRRLDLEAANLQGLPLQADAFLSLHAAPEAARLAWVGSGSIAFDETAPVFEERRNVESPIAPVATPIEGTIRLETSSGTHARVEGDFVLVVWGWDLSTTGSTVHSTITSGDSVRVTERSGVSRSLPAGISRQAYVWVRGGVLEIADPGAHEIQAWLTSADVTPMSAAQTPSALRRHLAPAAERGTILIDSPRSSREGTSTTLVGSSAEIAGTGAGRWDAFFASFLLFGAVAVPAAGLGVAPARRRYEEFRLSRLEDAFDDGDSARVVRLAQPLLSSKDFGHDAALLALESLVSLGRLEEAAAMLANLPSDAADLSPTIDFVRGYVLALRGQHEESAVLLSRCLDEANGFYEDIVGNPVFETVRRQRVLRAAVARATNAGVST
jgi:hypothetical protein